MISLFKKIIEWKLRLLAKWVLKKYRPQVIGITGSVGKTSTKEAVFTVLSSKFRVGKNIKNYNNELGVPLSILGSESGYKNPLAWIYVFLKALGLLLFRKKDYPEIMVLEMGADKPGDIRYLTKLAPCHIGVITAIGHVHEEFFGSLEKIIREKQILVTHLKKDDWAVLNADDALVMEVKDKIKARISTFGFSEGAEVRAAEPAVSAGPSPDPWVDVQIKGLSFKLMYQGSSIPVFLPSVLGEHQVYSALAAAAVGLALGVNGADISAALKNYKSPPGRMNLIPGIKHTSIIDDTYNSSPMAARAALSVLKKINVSGRKIAVFGDMLELGEFTESGHREVGEAVPGAADILVTVGDKAGFIGDEAAKRGLPSDKIHGFDNTYEAGKYIQETLRQGDIILVKGSQGARMERVVKELMSEPLQAKELLIRQGEEWAR
jgi:UDP-N-acetylmuramoyl-tripeptide--D-alanyl-D-alanine ligase